MDADAAAAKKAMTISNPISVKLQDKDFLSWGLTLLNLGTYGRISGGALKGKIYRLIGKSQSAKSFLARTVLAEAARNPEFDGYELIHDDIEKGVLLDNVKFFGQALASRIMAPAYSKDKVTKKLIPIYSTTIMSLYQRMQAKLDKGKKFIWIVDSQDSLLSEGTTKMGDGKAKIHADQMRKIIDGLDVSGGIVIFVHHAKVNLGFSWNPQDVTTGGASPEFYSSLDIRLAKLKTLKKVVGEKKYPIGNQIMAHITKNRVSGMDRVIKFPLYIDYGIDDIGANVEYLVDEVEHWKKGTGGVFSADEFEFEGTINKLVRKVEADGLQRELQILTGKVWQSIDKACSLNRKPRYT